MEWSKQNDPLSWDVGEAAVQQALNDMLNYGTYIERDGKRVDPMDFYVTPPEQLKGE